MEESPEEISARIRSSAERRLLASIDIDLRTGCWNWAKSKNKRGYGYIGVGSQKTEHKAKLAHRVSAWLFLNIDLDSALEVCHTCDTPSCVNPDHLFVGTHADNMRDMFAKGRRQAAKGERSGVAKVTGEQVKEIRRRLDEGEQQVPLAREYGIAQTQVSRIKRRESWRHIA